MKVAALLIVMTLPFAVTAEEKSKRPDAPPEIRICIPKQHTDLMVFLIQAAEAKGFFAAEGINAHVELLSFRFRGQAGPAANFRVETADQSINGRGKVCHFSVLSSAGVLALPENTRNSFTPLLLSEYGNNNDMDLVVAENSPFKTVKDLKGKIVRVTHISMLTALGQLLLKNGMNLNDVSIRGGNDVDHNPAGFIKGAQDAAFMLPMFGAVNNSRRQLRVLVPRILSSTSAKGLPGLFFVVDAAFFDMEPDKTKRLLSALEKARVYAQSHPEVLVEAAKRSHNETRKSQLEFSASEVNAAKRSAHLGPILDFHNAENVAKARGRLEEFRDVLNQLHVKNITPATSWIREIK